MSGSGRVLPCPSCGFNLEGHARVGTCPECGRGFDQATIALCADRPRLGWLQLFLPGLVLAALLQVVHLFFFLPWALVVLFPAGLGCTAWAWQTSLRLATWRHHQRLLASLRGNVPPPRRDLHRRVHDLLIFQIVAFIVAGSALAIVLDVLAAMGLKFG